MAECRLTESKFYLPSDVTSIADLLDCNTPSDDRSVDRIHSFIDEQRRKNTVKSTKRDLKNNPNAARAVTEKEEILIWEKRQLGDKSPRVLQFSLWFFFTKCFGLRGRQEHRQLCFGDVELLRDPITDRVSCV